MAVADNVCSCCDVAEVTCSSWMNTLVSGGSLTKLHLDKWKYAGYRFMLDEMSFEELESVKQSIIEEAEVF